MKKSSKLNCSISLRWNEKLFHMLIQEEGEWGSKKCNCLSVDDNIVCLYVDFLILFVTFLWVSIYLRRFCRNFIKNLIKKFHNYKLIWCLKTPSNSTLIYFPYHPLMMIHYHRLLLTFGCLFCIVSVHFISFVQILINLL